MVFIIELSFLRNTYSLSPSIRRDSPGTASTSFAIPVEITKLAEIPSTTLSEKLSRETLI